MLLYFKEILNTSHCSFGGNSLVLLFSLFPFLFHSLRSLAPCTMAQATYEVHNYLPDLMILYQNNTFKSVSCLALHLRVSLAGSAAKLNPFGRKLEKTQYSPVPLSTLGLTSGSDLGSTLIVTKFLGTDLAFLGEPCVYKRRTH